MNTKTIKFNKYWFSLVITSFLLVTILIYSPICNAQQSSNWQQWVQQLRLEAISQGVSAKVFDSAFADINGPDQKVLYFDRTQPEKRISYIQYQNSRIDSSRIRLGQSMYLKNQQLLTQIGNNYGVDPCVITAIWGVETSYSHFMGQYPVIKSLATLAYGSDRKDYFRSELLIALHILNDGHVTFSKFKGEWAGASGIPQFMPSSWQLYAVDYDRNGHKNIWGSTSDGLASIGNYLARSGWQMNQPLAIEVSLPSGFDSNLIGLKIAKPVNEWRELGVSSANNNLLPQQNFAASIIQPNGGPAFMVFNNFNALQKYNSSIFYGCAINYLANKICGR
jgi:membrane-bound lytic murein transglycosylase B